MVYGRFGKLSIGIDLQSHYEITDAEAEVGSLIAILESSRKKYFIFTKFPSNHFHTFRKYFTCLPIVDTADVIKYLINNSKKKILTLTRRCTVYYSKCTIIGELTN